MPITGRPFIKAILSGHVIEIYEYEKMPQPAKGRERRKLDDSDWLADKNGVVEQNQRKKRWNLIRLLNMNFDESSKFITLTFAENVKDLDAAHPEFDKFIKRMRRKYGNFKYAAVVEFQKRGAVHYHMISDLPYIPKQELARIWGQGFVRVNKIDHVDNIGAYISKYMTKDGKDIRLRGRKAYFTSKNLERPIELHGDAVDPLLDLYELKDKKTVFSSWYESEHHGIITYRQYNLKRICGE